MAKIRPLGNNVIIRRCKKKETTPGGLIIPDVAQKDAVEGIVVAVGPGKVNDHGIHVPLTLKEGDRVILPQWTNEVQVDGEEVCVVFESSILAVYEQDGEQSETPTAAS